LIGFGGAGLDSIGLPLVQEYVPAAKRGTIGGLVTACIPIGSVLGGLLGAFATPFVGWRGLFVIGLLPAAFTLLFYAWVPESPRWLVRRGRIEDARKALGWALEIDPNLLPLPATIAEPTRRPWHHIFKYPRSLAVSWLSILGQQAAGYGVTLWSATLIVMLLDTSPAHASYLATWIAVGGFVGRLVWSWLSEAIGRVPCGIIIGAGSAIATAAAGYAGNAMLGPVSIFVLLLTANRFFGEGGFAVIGPYAAEIWPSDLRASGMGSAYGFGSLGKVIGPLGLALIVGSSDIVRPQASLAMIGPAFLYLAAWAALSGLVYLFFAIETKGRSIEDIEAHLEKRGAGPIAVSAGAKIPR
jgi:putative MFS transporter